jgi:hypothetical protein
MSAATQEHIDDGTIQNQIKKLSAEELTRLHSWFADFDFTVWDLQIGWSGREGNYRTTPPDDLLASFLPLGLKHHHAQRRQH